MRQIGLINNIVPNHNRLRIVCFLYDGAQPKAVANKYLEKNIWIIHCFFATLQKKWPLRRNGATFNDCLPYENFRSTSCADYNSLVREKSAFNELLIT